MVCILSNDLTLIGNITECILQCGESTKYISLFFPVAKGSEWITLDTYLTHHIDELIVLAIKDENSRKNAIAFLDEMGCKSELVFDFFKLCKACVPRYSVERALLVNGGKSVDGIVLGISHAYVGIRTEYMKRNFLNLAFSHQDIFYNLKSLEYVISNNPKILSTVKYAVIDMFDYTYFNYDTSMSDNMPCYIMKNGYDMEPHNFSKRFTGDIHAFFEGLEAEKYKDISERDVDIWCQYFENYFSLTDYLDFVYDFRTDSIDEAKVDSFGFGSLPYKLHLDTITENISLFKKLIELLYSLNPSMRIYLVLLPRWYKIEKMQEDDATLSMWKNRFYDIINPLKDEYSFEVLDYKGVSDINSDSRYYADSAHFNALGAYRFTKDLEKRIYEDE